MDLDLEAVRAVLGVELGGVTIGRIATAIGILFFTLLLRGLLVGGLLQWLRHLAEKTEIVWDDAFIEATRAPLRWLITLYGSWVALRLLATPINLPRLHGLLDGLGPAILLFVGAWYLFRLTGVVESLLRKRAADPADWVETGLVPLFVSSIRIVVVMVSGLVIAQNLGYSVSGLIASLGLGGAAIALASQDTIANLFGSFMILADRPFRVGDWIKGDGFEGVVEEIGFRSTRIRTFGQTVESIPNRRLADITIENIDRRKDAGLDVRRVTMTVGVTYATTPDQMEEALEAIRKILAADEGVDQRMTQMVRFTDFGASSLDIFLYYFSNRAAWDYHLGVRERVNLEIMRALKKLGLAIAFPSHSLYIESFPPEVSRALEGRGGVRS